MSEPKPLAEAADTEDAIARAALTAASLPSGEEK